MKKIVFAGVFLLYVFGLSGCGNSYLEDSKEVSDSAGEYEDSDESLSVDTEIYVQVDGAVQSPGVYKLPYGARVYEAIEEAGGMLDSANAKSLNQAEKMEDGQKIYIPTISETEEVESASAISSDGTVNINLATVEDLMTLPGIGESKANDIVSYRDANGAFSKIEDIMNIPGIKEGIFNKISGSITVD